jgi:hypothetical protein
MATFKVVNTKSMASKICEFIEKLENEEMSEAEVNSFCKFSKEYRSYLEYELHRSKTMSDKELRDAHRNIENKNFDSV